MASIDIFQAIPDALTAANAIALEYHNPDSPDDKVACEAGLSKLLQDFLVPVKIATVISDGAADAIETVKGGTNAVSDIMTDLATAATAEGYTLNPLELMILEGFVTVAARGKSH